MCSKFVNCGQTCIAVNHVFVHIDQYEQFILHAKIVLDNFFISSHRPPSMYASAPGKSSLREVTRTFFLRGRGQGIRGSFHVFEPITTVLSMVFFLNQAKSFVFFGQGIVPSLLTPPSSSHAKIALTISAILFLAVLRFRQCFLRQPDKELQQKYMFLLRCLPVLG